MEGLFLFFPRKLTYFFVQTLLLIRFVRNYKYQRLSSFKKKEDHPPPLSNKTLRTFFL